MEGPPEKRRKKEQSIVTDDLWGDEEDDLLFSQMKLDNIEGTAQQYDNHQGNGVQATECETNNNCNNKQGGRSQHAAGLHGSSKTIVKSGGFHKSSYHNNQSEGYHTLPQASLVGSFNSGYSKTSKPPSESQGIGSKVLGKSEMASYDISKTNTDQRSTALAAKNQAGSLHGGLDLNKRSPTAGTTPNSTLFTASMQRKITAVEEENNFLKEENQRLRKEQFGKDGKIKVLRNKVEGLESEKNREKYEKMLHKEQQIKEQTANEKRLQSKVDKLESTLHFKDLELIQVQEQVKRLEKQARSNSGDRANNKPQTTSTGFPSPARSPRLKLASSQRQSPRSTARNDTSASPSRKDGDFPTSRSFLDMQMSPKSKESVAVAAGTPVRNTEEDSNERLKTCSATTETKETKMTVKPRMRLSVQTVQGHQSGAQLVHQLLDTSTQLPGSSEAQCPSAAGDWGIIGLLQHSVPHLCCDHNDGSQTCSMTRNQKSAIATSPECNHFPSAFDIRAHSLAQRGLSGLLIAPGWTTMPPYPEDINSCSSKQSLLLLPMIENYIRVYMDTMKECRKIMGSPDSQKMPCEREESPPNVDVKSRPRVTAVEKQTVRVLSVLEKLLEYSDLVRLALAVDKTELSETSIGVQDSNRESVDSNLLLDLDVSTLNIVKNCDIVNKLMKMANPLEFSNKMCNQVICELSIKCLNSVAENCSQRQLQKFSVLFSSECMSNCLCDFGGGDKPGQLWLFRSTLTLLTSLVKSAELLDLLCSQNDSCVLRTVYHCCEVLTNSAPESHRLAIGHKLFEFLSRILTIHETGPIVLFELDCECSSLVVKCVTVMILRELEVYEKTKSPFLLSFLRKGFSALNMLSAKDRFFSRKRKQECQKEFIQCVSSFYRMLKSLDDIDESDLSLVEELWDFDHEIDTDEDTSGEMGGDLSSPRISQLTVAL